MSPANTIFDRDEDVPFTLIYLFTTDDRS